MNLQDLAERYPLIDLTVNAAGRDWRITAVTDQSALVERIKTEKDLQNFPYGLMLWASAIGLSARLTIEASLVRGQRVLEIGAGIGIVGLGAAHLGGIVTQTDYLEDALALCQHNADVNGVHLDIRKGDWRNWPTDLTGFPLVIGSDVLYDRAMHPVLQELLPQLVAPGGVILLSDPIRPQALDFIERWEKKSGWTVAMEAAKVQWEGQTKDLAIFRLARKPTV